MKAFLVWRNGERIEKDVHLEFWTKLQKADIKYIRA